jgi:hypothetical protein
LEVQSHIRPPKRYCLAARIRTERDSDRAARVTIEKYLVGRRRNACS